jgi:hypothetical protein
MTKKQSEISSVPLWIVIWLLMLGILLKGHFAYNVVGDLGPPTWDFGIVQDVPGESPYAIYEKLPYPQHVKGQKGD